jgi:hypothetical protein
MMNTTSPYLVLLDERGISTTHRLQQRLPLERDVAGHVDESHDRRRLALGLAGGHIEALGRSAAHHAAVRVRQKDNVPMLLV